MFSYCAYVSFSVTSRDRGFILGICLHLGKTNRKQWTVSDVDLYFMDQWFTCYLQHYFIDLHTSDIGSIWHYEWPYITSQCDLYFMVQWFCLISPTLFDGFTSYLGYWFSMTLVWPYNTCRSLWPIFHGPVVLLNISNTILWIDGFISYLRCWFN